MKAIRVHTFGEPDVMQVEDVDLPPLQPDEILVQAQAIGVNPVDTYIRAGMYAAKPDLPYTPGLDAAGTVLEVGAQVTEFMLSDRVYCAGTISGTYAEQVICKASQVHPLPDHITYAQGAALGVPYATAYHALYHRTHIKAGQSILTHGASGGVGIAAVQLAKVTGLTVLATAGTDQGRDMVKRLGVDHVFDHHDPQRVQQVLDVTNNQGVDLILEMLANVNLGADLEMLRKNGMVIVVGNRGTIEINPRLLMAKNAAVIGMMLAHANTDELHDIHTGIIKGLQAGSLKPVIAQEIPLAEAPRAHHEIIEASHCGKIVLIP